MVRQLRKQVKQITNNVWRYDAQLIYSVTEVTTHPLKIYMWDVSSKELIIITQDYEKWDFMTKAENEIEQYKCVSQITTVKVPFQTKEDAKEYITQETFMEVL